MKLFAVLLLMVLCTKSEITYCKLKWADFNIKKSTDNTVSESVTSIGYSFIDNTVTVTCYFHKDESYVIKSAMTAYILNHEQRHFDITYIYSRKFEKELKVIGKLDEKAVEVIYNRILKEKDEMQDSYDNETANSEKREKQAEWDKKIDNLLTNL